MLKEWIQRDNINMGSSLDDIYLESFAWLKCPFQMVSFHINIFTQIALVIFFATRPNLDVYLKQMCRFPLHCAHYPLESITAQKLYNLKIQSSHASNSIGYPILFLLFIYC